MKLFGLFKKMLPCLYPVADETILANQNRIGPIEL